ncbi:hypothetical protein MJM71_23385, partial [Salmonella enterica subsp. enterica serovar Kentucky]|nr:hypothetical protein [Salmonella enterica subsp. enterica serovar Kentucky]
MVWQKCSGIRRSYLDESKSHADYIICRKVAFLVPPATSTSWSNCMFDSRSLHLSVRYGIFSSF